MERDAVVVAAEALLTFAIHGSVILGLTWVAVRALPLAERVEEVLWRFALVAGLATAGIQTACGGAALAAVSLRPVPAAVGVASPGPTPATAELRPPAERAAPDPGAVRPAASPPVDPAVSIVLGAALLALVGLARLGVRRVAVHRLLADRRPILPGSPFHDALDRLARRAGRGGRIRLSVSADLDAPVAFGVLRPEICVPRRALSVRSPACRDAMLAHELAHLLHRDPLWLEVGHSLRALFPWLPLCGTAVARLRELAEFRCDADGARLVGAVEVADCLVEVAGWIAAGRAPLLVEGVVGMTVQRHGLEARVDRLLAAPVRASRAPSPLRVAVSLTAATAVLAAALPGAGVGARPDVRALRSAASAQELPPHPLRVLLDDLDAERRALAVEVAALRTRAATLVPDPEITALLAAVDAQLHALGARQAALDAAIAVYEGALASSRDLTVRPEMFR